jgi:hypothetical protein
MEEPKVDTEETRDTSVDSEKTRDTPSKEDPPSQQGSTQQGLVEEEPAFHSDPDQDVEPPKVSWADQVEEDEIQEQLELNVEHLWNIYMVVLIM